MYWFILQFLVDFTPIMEIKRDYDKKETIDQKEHGPIAIIQNKIIFKLK